MSTWHLFMQRSSWRLALGIAASVIYGYEHGGWERTVAVVATVIWAAVAVAFLVAGRDPDRASVAEFEARRRALR